MTLGLCLALLTSAARPAAPPAAPPARFEELMQRARAAYADAAFDVALSELLAADAIAATDAQRVAAALAQGVVLANVPNLEAANAAWERGLAIDPNATLPLPASTKVRAEFEKLQRIVQRVRARPQPQPQPVSPERPVVTATEVRHVTIPAVMTAVLAAGSIAVGAALAAAMQSLDRELSTTPRPGAEVEAALSRRDALRAGAIAGYAVGAALAVVSVILFVRGVEVPASVAVLPGPGSAALLASFRF